MLIWQSPPCFDKICEKLQIERSAQLGKINQFFKVPVDRLRELNELHKNVSF